jgi:hypothetical protein
MTCRIDQSSCRGDKIKVIESLEKTSTVPGTLRTVKKRKEKETKKIDLDPRLKHLHSKMRDKDLPFAIGKAAYLAKP